MFFYQSEYGGRVFFNPPLGPPWDKHNCFDNLSSRDSSRLRGNAGIAIQQLKRDEFQLTNKQKSEAESKAWKAFKETGWHPLLDVKVRNLGTWKHVAGHDPIDNHRCNIMTKAALTKNSPTFIRVKQPQRIICDIQQASFDEDGEFRELIGQGWFGVASVEEVLVAKAASKGDADAMREFAWSRSYCHLAKNSISEVSSAVDLEAASYWLNRAKSCGKIEAYFEYAYLQDLITKGAVCEHLSFLNRICNLAKDRLRSLSWRWEPIDQELLKLAEKSDTPRLSEAIQDFVARARTPEIDN